MFNLNLMCPHCAYNNKFGIGTDSDNPKCTVFTEHSFTKNITNIIITVRNMNLIFQLNYGCVVAGLEGGRIKSSIMNMLNGYANL